MAANFALNNAFSIQPELLCLTKGAKVEENISGITDKRTIRLQYINVPVLARVNVGAYFFELGPQVGFNIAAKQKDEASNGTQSFNTTTDIKDDVKSVDLGYAAGLGY